ncbi:MAG TPA: hypothetical protein DCL61_11150, partial [Cyanobacteria bacterium UBA12227]|nr:hypothetical protein [Cyanobacteria bacterium UBA12227]
GDLVLLIAQIFWSNNYVVGGFCKSMKLAFQNIKYIAFFTSLFILNISTLPAQACSPGNPNSTVYIRRDGNRCEGIKQRNVNRGLRLISFATIGINNYPSNLSLKIPSITNTTPNVIVQSLDKNYILDDLSLTTTSDKSLFTFSWNSFVLNQAQIIPTSLRALADVNLGSQVVYVPVILERPSGQYQFVFYTSNRAKFTTLQIRRNNQVIHTSPRNNFQRGEVVFNWDARKVAAGRYELYIIAEQEQIGRPPEIITKQISFEHNPKWLR